MKEESLKFFLNMVLEATLRARYYNGEKKLFAQCTTLEQSNREYMNKCLAKMRELGYSNVPEDIPARNWKNVK